MGISNQFRDELLAMIPSQRAFGLSLTSRGDRADLMIALAKLPEDQREAIVLVGASGFSYEEAAEICGCAVGTIKSRMSRARNRLSELLQIIDDRRSRAEGIKTLGTEETARA
jgi:RNA polymerase sigma-70 factor (ECF subfamily)